MSSVRRQPSKLVATPLHSNTLRAAGEAAHTPALLREQREVYRGSYQDGVVDKSGIFGDRSTATNSLYTTVEAIICPSCIFATRPGLYALRSLAVIETSFLSFSANLASFENGRELVTKCCTALAPGGHGSGTQFSSLTALKDDIEMSACVCAGCLSNAHTRRS